VAIFAVKAVTLAREDEMLLLRLRKLPAPILERFQGSLAEGHCASISGSRLGLANGQCAIQEVNLAPAQETQFSISCTRDLA
jgi:hypothetical protein